MPHQINIFIENRPGRLRSITEILTEAKVNIRAFTIQDRGDFGLIKLIVDKPKQGQLALADRQFACALKDVLAVSIPDRPGNLHKLTSVFFEHNINIVDAYGFVLEPNKEGVCCIEFENAEDLERCKALVVKEGFKVLEDEELYEF
ncbi:MAG: ACT domain-containing protein [Phycisphaerae bacterium]|nr:ACT domain-containing protein [Phycisphaerae bacterium]